MWWKRAGNQPLHENEAVDRGGIQLPQPKLKERLKKEKIKLGKEGYQQYLGLEGIAWLHQSKGPPRGSPAVAKIENLLNGVRGMHCPS